MIVGHAHPEVTAAVRAQIEKGTTFFANNAKGIELAEVIVDAVPCADKVRFASTGSEADAFAIRLARAYRGRSKILKFEGGYHGYSDYGLMSLAPPKPGNDYRPQVRTRPASLTTCATTSWSRRSTTSTRSRPHRRSTRETIAAVFMEPFQRLIPPRPGFLEAMRELTEKNDILLCFDEVVTGFRLSYGGAQAVLRRHPGSLHPRQGHRRRLPALGHRRPRGGHGAVRPRAHRRRRISCPRSAPCQATRSRPRPASQP